MPAPRVAFATIAVSGLGLFVAASIGVTLYVSGAAGVRSTQQLLAEQAEKLIDSIEHRLDMMLRPVDDQAAWIARAVGEGEIDLQRAERLEAFMFGALSATPQVASVGIVDPQAALRRWMRGDRREMRDDLSQSASVRDWLAGGQGRTEGSWRAPLWTPRQQATVLLHDAPLRREGRFLGMLTQVVPVEALSKDLAEFAQEGGATPFILFGDRVLAHPALARQPRTGVAAQTLPRLDEVGDRVLQGFATPDTLNPFGMRKLARARAVSTSIGGVRYLYIHRDIVRYGAQPWTLGAYVNVEDAGYASEMRQVVLALAAGGGVLVLAVLVAAFAGRRLSRPIQAFAHAAKLVEDERLDDVPQLPGSAIAEYDDASRSFNQMVEGLRERRLIRRTLGRVVSKEVARRLLKAGGRLEPVDAEATVLFCDLEGFTPLTESLGPAGVVSFLNAYFEVMVAILERHGGLMTQYQGDALLAVFNVPVENPEHACAALRAGIEMVRATEAQAFAGVSVRNRVGISSGHLVAGSIGARGRLAYTVHGNVVNLASRLEALNKEYGTRLLVAGETARRCPGIALRKVAEVAVRGYSEAVQLYTPEAQEGAAPR